MKRMVQTMPLYQLRKANGRQDADFVYALKKQVLRGYIEELWGWDEAFQLQYHAAHYQPQYTHIIEVEGQPAGTVEITEDAAQLFICGLYLTPHCQGQGIGTDILTRCLEQAALLGKKVGLEVLLSNTRARQLYQRMGFVVGEANEPAGFKTTMYCLPPQLIA